jgi:UDP-N-acetylmuramoyl-tripeptide--D-alanyl-D-alanine ligase
MIPLTLGSIAAITGGEVVGGSVSAVVSGDVVIDSRQVSAGGLFVAVVGERVDGHLFAVSAHAAGAVGVLGTSAVSGVPCVVVDDVVAALAALARHVLSVLPSVVIAGITGSSGKTSTKDIAAQLVGRLGPTVAPAGSYNTEYGLPLTILRCDSSTRYLVLEMSARGIGHIAYLCRIAPPLVGVVLNVGHAHAGEFGSQEAIAVAKGELVEALPSSGVAILNADDPRVAAMASRTQARVITFSVAPPGAPASPPLPAASSPLPAAASSPLPAAASPPLPAASPPLPPSVSMAPSIPLERVDGAIGTFAAEVRAEGVRLDELGRASFTLVMPEGTAPVSLRLHGAHQVSNALAAAALARELGLRLDEIAAGLSEAAARSKWRMEVSTRADGVIVINDAYNANPESVRAALDALAHLARDGRAFAVLGHMAELGSTSAAAHAEIGAYAAATGVAGLIAVGDEALPILDGAERVPAGSWPGEVFAVPDGAAAVELLRDRLKPGDVVLVKASRAAALESAAAQFLSEADQ